MKEIMYKKILLFGIVFLFFGAAILPSISGYNQKSIQSTIEKPSSFSSRNDYVLAHWKFDDCSGDTLEDSSGHNYDGTIYGASWVSHGSGCALEFDGVNDYVELKTYAAQLGFNKTDDMVFSFEFRSDSDGIMFCIDGWEHVPEARFELCPNGSIHIKFWTTVCGIPTYSTEGWNDNSWHDVEVFYNGITEEPTIKIYIDGDLEGSRTKWLCPQDNTDFHYAKIGKRALEDEGHFEGIIDELKIIKYPNGNEQDPPTIDGPIEGEPLEEYQFTFVTEDPEGDDVQIHIDWDDGTFEDWDEWYQSGEVVTVSHTWDEDDRYEIKAESKDIWGDSVWSDPHVFKIGNQPPTSPEITGQRYGNTGQQITYTFKSHDEENQNVKYKIRWDDGDIDETEYVPSDTAVELSHSWNTKDDFFVSATAIDSKNKEGDPSIYHVRIGDLPPNKPSIYGAVQGIPGKAYEYGFITYDPENDNLTYDIDWDDGNIETDFGPFPSGQIFARYHVWNQKDTFLIKSRAKDEFGNPGDWSEHTIIVVRNKAFNLNLLEILFERFPRLFHAFKYLRG